MADVSSKIAITAHRISLNSRAFRISSGSSPSSGSSLGALFPFHGHATFCLNSVKLCYIHIKYIVKQLASHSGITALILRDVVTLRYQLKSKTDKNKRNTARELTINNNTSNLEFVSQSFHLLLT